MKQDPENTGSGLNEREASKSIHVQGVQLITRVLGLVLVLFFRFLLICQLEGLDLAFALKGFEALQNITSEQL